MTGAGGRLPPLRLVGSSNGPPPPEPLGIVTVGLLPNPSEGDPTPDKTVEKNVTAPTVIAPTAPATTPQRTQFVRDARTGGGGGGGNGCPYGGWPP
ncbi:hypothetical protein [Mycobacterium sp. NPDC006124]|uniref:hypothetical protein n=1 Tax=Mycobacterium sp. NPDC006124 TaxID=3156729 RepID=UPI0033BF73D7